MKFNKLFSAALLLTVATLPLTTSCDDYLKEKSESFIGPD